MLHDSLSLTARDLSKLEPFAPVSHRVDPVAAGPAPVGAVSFDRCIDWLTDARHATSDVSLQQLIDAVALELAVVGRDAVHADPALADAVVGSLASVESALVAAVS